MPAGRCQAHPLSRVGALVVPGPGTATRRWSGKNRQWQVLPSTAHARQTPSDSERRAAAPQKYTPAFKAECVRQVAAGARAQGLSPALLGRWQRQALAEAAAVQSAKSLSTCAPGSNAWSRRATC
ncbi:transposase [Hymenobacter cheonanensis]|uniref:transposase n=1 Tax=Hymenobacter sp. CA2-7 TaxID=3063993 RepID=UPI00350F8E97